MTESRRAQTRQFGQYFFSPIKVFISNAFGFSDDGHLRGIRILLRVSILFFIIMVFWASFFQINQVVHAQGQVIASARTQLVQAADDGVLVDMKVREGDEVKVGEIIAVLEKTRALAAYVDSQYKVMALRMTIERLQAEISGNVLFYGKAIQEKYPALYESQINLYNKRRKALNDKLFLLADNIRITQKELELNLPLEKTQDVSKADILRLERAVNDARHQYMNTQNEYLQNISSELNKTQEELSSQEQNMKIRTQIMEQTDIIAPASGIVKNVKITTLGGVVRKGEEILQIFPTESELVVEAKVNPVDIANIKVGQSVNVKFDAYDYSIFGSMSGRVTYVSADTLLRDDPRLGSVPYYRVKASIANNDVNQSRRTRDIEIRPGMTVVVDLETGRRSVMTYLLKPLVKTFSEAFVER